MGQSGLDMEDVKQERKEETTRDSDFIKDHVTKSEPETMEKTESDSLEQAAGQLQVSGKAKRIAAMSGVVLLVVMAAATLVVACLDFAGSQQVFMALLLGDIAIPVFLWFILHFLS